MIIAREVVEWTEAREPNSGKTEMELREKKGEAKQSLAKPKLAGFKIASDLHKPVGGIFTFRRIKTNGINIIFAVENAKEIAEQKVEQWS